MKGNFAEAVQNGYHYENCVEQKLELSCPVGYSVFITHAQWKEKKKLPVLWNYQEDCDAVFNAYDDEATCNFVPAMQFVNKHCASRRTCKIPVSPPKSSYPCKYGGKDLDVWYTCGEWRFVSCLNMRTSSLLFFVYIPLRSPSTCMSGFLADHSVWGARSDINNWSILGSTNQKYLPTQKEPEH